jgi:hypothetical protein
MMRKRCVAVILICVLFSLTMLPEEAYSESQTEIELGQKVRRAVLELGIGPRATIRVTLRDKTKLSGSISVAGLDTFTIIDSKSRAAVPIAYTEVSTVNARNLSTGAKIAIGVAVGVGAFFLIAYALFLNWSS